MTTDFFVMDAPDSDDYFPDDDFFPDVDNLLDDMAGDDTDPKSSASAVAAVPYVFFLFLLEVFVGVKTGGSRVGGPELCV